MKNYTLRDVVKANSRGQQKVWENIIGAVVCIAVTLIIAGADDIADKFVTKFGWYGIIGALVVTGFFVWNTFKDLD